MLSLPCIVERSATPYFALRKDVTLPFDDKIPAILTQLSAYLVLRGLEAPRPVFFKHNVVDMPHLQMEFGVPLAHPVEAGGEFTSGVLPAGPHVEITYTGPYEDLITVNAVLIGWSKRAGLVFTGGSSPTANGSPIAPRSCTTARPRNPIRPSSARWRRSSSGSRRHAPGSAPVAGVWPVQLTGPPDADVGSASAASSSRSCARRDDV